MCLPPSFWLHPEIFWFDFFVLGLSLSFFYSGGMCLNDIMDVAIDRIKKPFRPLPAGFITIKSADRFTAFLFVAGLSLLFALPYQRSVFAGLLLLAVIVIYDKYHKAHPFSVILMASCRLMIFVISAMAVTGEVALLPAAAGAVQFVYTLFISVTARYENSRATAYRFPIIPLLIAGMCLVDGVMMAVFRSGFWLAAGIIGMGLTIMGQKYVRGD